MKSGLIFDNLGELGSPTPMILITLPLLIIIIMRRVSYKLFEKSGFTIWKSEAVADIDEELPNFFEAVKLSDADWMVFENSNLRENYGYNFIPKEVEDRLDDW